MSKLRTGDGFWVNTNAEFLNQVFGTNYKAWMKSGWTYPPDTIVWMVWLDDKVRNGWLNTIVDASTVREDYVGKPEERLPSHYGITHKYRIIVKKQKGCYTILGKYICDEGLTNNKTHVWRKISDEI